MEKLKVKDITLLMDKNLSIRPSVSVEDKITDAIEVMLKKRPRPHCRDKQR